MKFYRFLPLTNNELQRLVIRYEAFRKDFDDEDRARLKALKAELKRRLNVAYGEHILSERR